MSIGLRALTCGGSPCRWTLSRREPGRLRVPVPVFLIDHPKGKVLFDSGMHPGAGVEAADRLGLRGEDLRRRARAERTWPRVSPRSASDAREIRYLATRTSTSITRAGTCCSPTRRSSCRSASGKRTDRRDCAANLSTIQGLRSRPLRAGGRTGEQTSRRRAHRLPADLSSYARAPFAMRVRLDSGTSCWRATPVTSTARSSSSTFRRSCSTARRCSLAAGRCAPWRDAARRHFLRPRSGFWASVPQAPLAST